MEFSSKEKRLLLILLIVAVLMAYVQLILRPQLDKRQQLISEIDNYKNIYNMNIMYKDKLNQMDKSVKTFGSKFKELRETYPPIIKNEEIIVILDTLKNEAGVKIESSNFSSINQFSIKQNEAPIAGDTDLRKSISDTSLIKILEELGLVSKDNYVNNEVSLANGNKYAISVTISGSGSNSQIKKFVDLISNLKNKVIINNLSINEQKDNLNFNLTVDFIGILDKNVQDYTILPDGQWKAGEGAGKDTLFNLSDASKEDESIKNSKVEALLGYKKSNFNMVAIPYGYGMTQPSLTLGASNILDNTGNIKNKTIYADNKGIENAELYISQKGEKFFFKFKTSQEAYPTSDYKNIVEFLPVDGKLQLYISSYHRTSNEDNSGVNLTINNTTSKTLSIKIKDDTAKPRVTINPSSPKTYEVEYIN